MGALALPPAACAWQADAPAGVAARREHVGGLLEAGRYDDAAAAARAGDLPELALLLGDALLARGDRAGATAAFRRALAGPDSLTGRLRLATLMHERGEHEAALREFDAFIDVYNRSESLTPAEVMAVGTAVRYLGVRDPALFRDAMNAYDEAIAAAPDDPTPRILIAELFLEKYNAPDAREALAPVLSASPSHPRALLAMARLAHFEGTAEAMPLLERALAVNPSLVPARVLKARLLLDQEDDAEAEAELRRALEVDAASAEALSLLAAIHWLRGDGAALEETRRRVLAANPRYAALDATISEVAVRRRRYREAADLSRAAVALDSTSSAALGLLGLNELRLGRTDAARAALERAFARDPYNVWFKNSLDLLDTLGRFRTVRTPRFELVMDPREADLLALYAEPLAEEAYTALAERYGARPETPVRVEIYPSHADFSVRTVGLAGLGALGVSFGNVLAMDSPSARERGAFHWGSTLWHEIAHAVTLAASDHRVPRWLTEGISVLEERRARPGWGSETTPAFLVAYGSGDLPTPSRLSELFARPASAEQLAHGYHYASLVAEWIEETRGIEAIRSLLRGYAAGRGDATVEEVLGMDETRFDREFDAWLRRQPPPKPAAETEGANDDDAAALERAVWIYPMEVAPHQRLAELYATLGDHERAVRERRAVVALAPVDLADALYRLALALRDAGDRDGARRQVLRALEEAPGFAAAQELLLELGASDGGAGR